jgi:hypothetical protein
MKLGGGLLAGNTAIISCTFILQTRITGKAKSQVSEALVNDRPWDASMAHDGTLSD